MKVLVIGPSATRSKGGMATVIGEILDDEVMQKNFEISAYESYIDGSKLKVMAYSIWAFAKFIFTRQAEKYDLFHIHAASYGSTFRKGAYVWLLKKHGKKIILHIHGAEYMQFYERQSARNQARIRNILESADMVVALSQEWKNRFDSTMGLSHCVVLENGIDNERLQSCVTPPAQYRNAFLTLGRLGDRKGTYDLIDATEQVVKIQPDVKVYLAGDGEIEKVSAQIRAKKLEDHMEVVGWADMKKKMELLRRVSTVVLPSYNEGLPMCILEGMACGKAIISTTVGAIPEVVKSDNGILIAPGDVKGLADAMVRCCRNTEVLSAMSNANRKKIGQQYSRIQIHKRLACYYEEVMNG